MKLFNHHLAVPTLLLASLEACVFFLLLSLFTVMHFGDSSLVLLASSFDAIDLAMICLGFLLLLAALGLYERDAVYQFGVLLQRSVIFLFVIVFAGLAAWLLDDLFPSIHLPTYASLFALATVLNFVAVMATRLAFSSLPKPDFFKRRVLVLGRGDLGHRIRSFLNEEGGTTLQEVGYVDFDDVRAGSDGAAAAKPADIYQLARELDADEVVIASQEWRGLPVWSLLDCKMLGIRVTDYLTFWERETGRIDLDQVKPSWLALSDGFRRSELRLFVKRTFDIVVSLALLTVTFPLLAMAAILIKLDSPGPVFYRQDRIGRNGEIFEVIKFRSMRADAERDGQPKWASRIDPRVTRVGLFLRRSRIDEIPQIINVLLGDMSFVGPRPERPYFVKELAEKLPYYEMRHNVRPGITGWAQVNYPYGASVEDARNKLEYDLYYVKNGSLFLDIVILLQTVRVVLFGEGAR